MNINVTSLKFNFHSSGALEIKINSTERMSIDNYHRDYDSSYYISKYDLPLAANCMYGVSTVYPYFDDINYLIKFHTDGMKVIELSDSTPCKYLYFTFPLGKLYPLHTAIENHIYNPSDMIIEYNQEDFREWDKLYHSRCRFILQNISHSVFNNDTFQFTSTIEAYLKDSIKRDVKSNPELRDYLQRLNRIARNYSTFGEVVLIYLSFDSYYDAKHNTPSSYYFDIRRDDSRLMNGGLIAHHNEKDNTFSYSMHT